MSLEEVVAVKFPIVTLSNPDGLYPEGVQFPKSEKLNPELSPSPPTHVRSAALNAQAPDKNNEANKTFFIENQTFEVYGIYFFSKV